MARVEVHEDRVVIRLTSAEKTAALHRGDITLPRAAITSAVVTDDPWVWIRGVRAPGLRVLNRVATGTWRGHFGTDFVLAKRGREAVVIDLDVSGEPDVERGWTGEFDRYARVILSTRHAAALITALRLEDDGIVVTD